jgi:hypothetical protein
MCIAKPVEIELTTCKIRSHIPACKDSRLVSYDLRAQLARFIMCVPQTRTAQAAYPRRVHA